jgi:hypothetical protein
MQLHARKIDDNGKSIFSNKDDVVGPDDVVVLALGGMTTTGDNKVHPNMMGGAFLSYSDSLAKSSGMIIGSDFVGGGHKKANGFAKIAEDLLGGADVHKAKIKGKNIDLLTISTDNVQQNIADIVMANKFDGYVTNEAMELVSKVLLPKISNNSAAVQTELGWNIRGERLPVDEAKERLSKVTVFAQSYGTSVARMMENALDYSMKQLGYSSGERRDLAKQVAVLGTGNITNEPVPGSTRFNSVYMQSSSDKVIDMLKDDHKPVVMADDERLFVIATPGRVVAHVKTYDNMILPDVETNVLMKFSDPSTHNVRQYVTRDRNADIRPDVNNDVNAQIAENVLRNMVTREPDAKALEFFDFAKSLAPEPKVVDIHRQPTGADVSNPVQVLINRVVARAT